MTDNIITFPTDTPPTPPTVPTLERRRFPVVIPAFYTQHDIDRRLRGEFTPVHLGTVTRHTIYDIEALTIAKLQAMPRKQERRIA